jgi:hypothetical protein
VPNEVSDTQITIAAAAFGAILYTVVTGDSIVIVSAGSAGFPYRTRRLRDYPCKVFRPLRWVQWHIQVEFQRITGGQHEPDASVHDELYEDALQAL